MTLSEVNDEIVDDTSVSDTTPEASDEIQYEDAIKWKDSLEKATSNYVLPGKEMLKKYGVKTFAGLEQKLSQEKENFITKESHELDKFLTKNEELSDKSEELLATAKALQSVPKYKDKSLQELLIISAKTLKVEEETQASQEKLKKSRVSDGDSFSDSGTISKADYIKIASSNQSKYAELSNKIEKGLIKVVE